MADKNKKGFRTVNDADMEEYKQKIRQHRLKLLRYGAIIAGVFLVIAAGIGLYMAFRQYGVSPIYRIRHQKLCGAV